MHCGWIYCITNLVNGKKYVGQTRNKGGYKCRWDDHKKLLRANKHVGRNGKADHLQNAWNKYGEENFDFILLHEIISNTEEECKNKLDELEIHYIKTWKLLNRDLGYNIADGGGASNNFAGKTKEEMIEIKSKMSNSHKGKHNGFYGKHHSEYSKNKISNSKKGKYVGESNPFYGKKHSDSSKNKVSESKKGKKNYARAKKIAMLDKNTNEILIVFDSVADANEYLGVSRKNKSIHTCARGKYKTALGYKWKYIKNDGGNI